MLEPRIGDVSVGGAVSAPEFSKGAVQGEQDRALWQSPVGPPARPEGAPTTHGPMSQLSGYRSDQNHTSSEPGTPLATLWAWIDGMWQTVFVKAEGTDTDGWRWLWVHHHAGSGWVLETRTAAWEPSPELMEWAARIRHTDNTRYPDGTKDHEQERKSRTEDRSTPMADSGHAATE
jgi:hypothetical protein